MSDSAKLSDMFRGGTMTRTTDVAPVRPHAASSSVVNLPDIHASRTAAIRLLIVDGRPLVRWALSRMTEDAADLHTVGEVTTAAEAIDVVYALKPDAVTIDCSLPDGQGWQLARDLRDRYGDLGIVLMTAEGSDDLLFRGTRQRRLGVPVEGRFRQRGAQRNPSRGRCCIVLQRFGPSPGVAPTAPDVGSAGAEPP